MPSKCVLFNYCVCEGEFIVNRPNSPTQFILKAYLGLSGVETKSTRATRKKENSMDDLVTCYNAESKIQCDNDDEVYGLQALYNWPGFILFMPHGIGIYIYLQ